MKSNLNLRKFGANLTNLCEAKNTKFGTKFILVATNLM